MNEGEQKHQGTGLRDAYAFLEAASRERLLSLTLQLGESPEEAITLALCLILLHRQAHALDKLQPLRENPLAEHLTEKLHSSRNKREDFAVVCDQFQPNTSGSLALLARIFKVLSEQRLCDGSVRDLAYRRALSSESFQTCHSNNLELLQLREEARALCGPEVVPQVNSGCYLNTNSNNDNTTLNVDMLQESSELVPCSLKDCPSDVSYPSHLEISISPTVSFQENTNEQPSGDSKQKDTSLSLLKNAPSHSVPSMLQPCVVKSSLPEQHPSLNQALSSIGSNFTSETSMSEKMDLSSQKLTPMSSACVSKELYEHIYPAQEEEEEKEVFYAFVILHAPEDDALAGRLRAKIEKAIGSEGATFSDDFAIPGKCTLQCVEDAVENSAFTFLLLTPNFNTKMLEMKTNVALVNSINNQHKFNTVIPLLPKENSMSQREMPLVLKTLVPLDENRSFERRLQKSLSQAKIRNQKKLWRSEQELKIKKRSQQNEDAMVQRSDNCRTWWPQPSNIHIENANYIMIGNDSKMTVGLGGSENKEASVHTGQDD